MLQSPFDAKEALKYQDFSNGALRYMSKGKTVKNNLFLMIPDSLLNLSSNLFYRIGDLTY